MKRLILLLSTSLYLIGNTAFGQSVHYFGTNPSYNHYPQDLLLIFGLDIYIYINLMHHLHLKLQTNLYFVVYALFPKLLHFELFMLMKHIRLLN